MARLIDADKLREDWLTKGENEYIYDTNAFLDSIDEQPTVDAVEVVHAMWIKTPYERTCPVCKDRHSYYGWEEWNFCKNCGTKMDGGNEDRR